MAPSGCSTALLRRGSAEVFCAYDDYYALYFPQGGSTVLKVILTESTHLQ